LGLAHIAKFTQFRGGYGHFLPDIGAYFAVFTHLSFGRNSMIAKSDQTSFERGHQ
jgi:hypothetical protein